MKKWIQPIGKPEWSKMETKPNNFWIWWIKMIRLTQSRFLFNSHEVRKISIWLFHLKYQHKLGFDIRSFTDTATFWFEVTTFGFYWLHCKGKIKQGFKQEKKHLHISRIQNVPKKKSMKFAHFFMPIHQLLSLLCNT